VLFENCELALRSKVGDLAVENGPDIMKRIAEFSATIRTTRGENLRIMVGLQSIRVIAEQKALESPRNLATNAEGKISRCGTRR